jgi:hypothetical protein
MFGWPIDGDCLDVGNKESYREANRWCWERDGGSFHELRPYIDAGGADEEIQAVLAKLERDPRTTLITLAVDPSRVGTLTARYLEEPRTVPVNVVCRADGPLRDQAEAMDANLTLEQVPGQTELLLPD